MLTGGVDTGWTFYTPFSSTYSNTYVMLTAVGVFITGFSSILTGLNFIVTIHTMRAPGMTWFRLPLFIWSHVRDRPDHGSRHAGAGDHASSCLRWSAGFHIGIFDPALGGDPVLFQHLFWFYSHPAVYIMILPGDGRDQRGHPVLLAEAASSAISFVALSSVAIAVHRISGLGPPHVRERCNRCMPRMVFSLLSYLVAIPSAIKVFNWTATLYKARSRIRRRCCMPSASSACLRSAA